MAAPPALPARAVEALRRGDVIAAIRYLRAVTPLDLQGAKNAIDAYRRGETTNVVAPKVLPSATATSSAADAMPPIEHSAGGERMRQATGFGLDGGRDVDSMTHFRDRAGGVGGRSPGEMPRRGPLLRWIVVLALLGWLLYALAQRAVHV